MASSNVVQKGTKCTWGTSEVKDPGTGGIVVSADLSVDNPVAYQEDEDGARIGLVFYDETYSGTITVVCKESCNEPTAGKEVTVDSFTCYSKGYRISWQHKGKKQIVISVEGGKNIA